MPDLSALIQRWQRGDPCAVETIYNHHRESTLRLAYGLLGNFGDTPDPAPGPEHHVMHHRPVATYSIMNAHTPVPNSASELQWKWY